MRALVVGHGRMGGFHRQALADLGHHVTTVDPSPAASADHLAVPRGRFDVVCVACPISDLAEQAHRWVGHDGWLLIEKPMASTAAAARELAGLLDGQRVAVGYVERFNPRVRELRARLEGHRLLRGEFTRWNDRPSVDLGIDLRAHDVDLARHLGVRMARYSTRDSAPVRRRRIAITTATAGVVTADLLSHRQSPLHDMWRAFLANGPHLARPADAVATLEAVSHQPMTVAA